MPRLWRKQLVMEDVLKSKKVLAARVEAGDVRLEVRGASWDRPSGIESLEEIALLHGPPLFDWLVDQFEHKQEIERVMGVSHATLSRWINLEVGQTFGQRSDDEMRSYRSIWFGYPSPLPGFDRLCEELYDADDSFISICVRQFGLTKTLRWLRQDAGFGLEMLRAEPADIFAAGAEVGIPPVTVRRWMCGRKYPTQWCALDALTKHVLGVFWLEALIYVRPMGSPRQVPLPALRSMIEESLFVS